MRPVFKDPELEAEFQELGYARIPFLSAEEVEFLKERYFATIGNSGGSMLADEADFKNNSEITYEFTFIDRNSDYKAEVFDIITKAFQKQADHYLDHFKPIIANFIHKKENGGEVPLHQNWAFVDERKYTSISIWCPLVDSSRENGTLEMVDRSHKRFGEIRGPMIPWEAEGLKNEIIENYLTPMNVKAGEAVVLDDSILHYSHNNSTPGLRLAIQLIMIPEECNSIHYHLDPSKDKNQVEVLEVDKNFYMTFHPWIKPKDQKRIKTLPYKEAPLTHEQFMKIWKGPRFDMVTASNSGGWLKKVTGMFSSKA